MPLTKFIWDVESDNVLTETDENDVTTAVYTSEPDEFGSLISQRRGNVTSTYQYDALGSTRELTDSTETVTDSYTYTAFGESVATSGTTMNPFQYVGELGYYFDTETDDYYIRARVYSPTVARWTSVDPMENVVFEGLYVYAMNRPVNVVDPSGLQAKKIINPIELLYSVLSDAAARVLANQFESTQPPNTPTELKEWLQRRDMEESPPYTQ